MDGLLFVVRDGSASWAWRGHGWTVVCCYVCRRSSLDGGHFERAVVLLQKSVILDLDKLAMITTARTMTTIHIAP